MKKIIINSLIKQFKKKNYNQEQVEIIKYGLESIYILITKTIFVFIVAYLLNIFKEVLVFSILYNIIRMPSFGLHATKSWICLVSSTLIFIIAPYVCNTYQINIFVRLCIGIICILLIFKNAPADTYKRPIVDKKRRRNYKIISGLISIIMVTISMVITNNFLCNSLIFVLVVQCFMISPLVYSIFKLPYDNYKRFEKTI